MTLKRQCKPQLSLLVACEWVRNSKKNSSRQTTVHKRANASNETARNSTISGYSIHKQNVFYHEINVQFWLFRWLLSIHQFIFCRWFSCFLPRALLICARLRLFEFEPLFAELYIYILCVLLSNSLVISIIFQQLSLFVLVCICCACSMFLCKWI